MNEVDVFGDIINMVGGLMLLAFSFSLWDKLRRFFNYLAMQHGCTTKDGILTRSSMVVDQEKIRLELRTNVRYVTTKVHPLWIVKTLKECL